tara:strand:- start:146 stop:403 length:258 start_codon:yes stop_codon:yes gene_type:complete
MNPYDNMNETQRELVLDLAEDFAPFVKKVESGMALTQNHYGAYGSMISKLSKGNRAVALIFSYALMMAGANGQGISDAMKSFFPK